MKPSSPLRIAALCLTGVMGFAGCGGGDDAADETVGSTPPAVATSTTGAPSTTTTTSSTTSTTEATTTTSEVEPDTTEKEKLSDITRAEILTCVDDLIDQADEWVLGRVSFTAGQALIEDCDDAAEAARSQGFTALASKVREPLTNADRLLFNADVMGDIATNWSRDLGFWRRDINAMLRDA